MDFIVFGGLVADRYFYIDNYPYRGQDTFINGEAVYVGGCAINIAACINNLGGKAHVVSYIGNDKIGEQILEYIKHNGFSDKFVKKTDGESGYCLVFKENNGERTFMTKKGIEGIFDGNLLENLNTINVSAAAVTGYYLINKNASSIMDCMEIMRVSGTKFVFDPGPLVGEIDNSILKRMFRISSIITPNETDLAVIEKIEPDFRENFKTKTLIIKKGLRGGTCITPDGEFNYSSVNVNTIDTTGAGDSFKGAL